MVQPKPKKGTKFPFIIWENSEEKGINNKDPG